MFALLLKSSHDKCSISNMSGNGDDSFPKTSLTPFLQILPFVKY